MKIRLLFLCYLPGFFSGLLAQTGPVTYHQTDTAYAARLIREARSLLDSTGWTVFEGALEKLMEADSIYTRTTGKETREYASVLHETGRFYSRKGDYNRAFEFLQKGLELRLRVLGPEHPEVGDSHRKLGSEYSSTEQYLLGIGHQKAALAIYTKAYGPESFEAGGVYSNLGLDYSDVGEHELAEQSLQKALGIMIKVLKPEHSKIAYVYLNLGNVYLAKGDYEQAVKYFQTSLDIFLKNFGTENSNVASNCLNLGNAYQRKGEDDLALKYFQNASDILVRISGPEDPGVGSMFLNIGTVYINKGDYSRAIDCFQKGATIMEKVLGPDHPFVAYFTANLAKAYWGKGDRDRAMDYFGKVVQMEQTSGVIPIESASSYLNSGEFYYLKGDYARAIEFTKKSLDIRKNIFGQESPETAKAFQNLTVCYQALRDFNAGKQSISQALQALRYNGVSTLPQVNSVPQLIETLWHKGKFYQAWHLAGADRDHLIIAHEAFAEADAAIEYQHKNLENPGAKYALAERVRPVYEAAIATDYLLQKETDSLVYGQEAFGYAEKSKAIVLYGAMKELNALHFAGLPDSLLQTEYRLRIDLTYQDKKRQAYLDRGLPLTDSAMLAIDLKLFELRRGYENLKKRFERDYPAYYRLRYDLSATSIRQIREELLQPGQTLLEYFVGDSSIYIFVVGEKTFQVTEVKKDFPLETWVAELRKNLLKDRGEGAAEYCDRAYRLYEKLMAPVKAQLTEDLIIIPDGALNYLPFETLLTQKPVKPTRFQQHAYVLNDYTIGYCYSATLLREMRQKQHRDLPDNILAAFAPYYTGDTTLLSALFASADFRKDLKPLKHSGSEVFGIQKILGGQVFYGNDATEARFMEQAGHCRVLHLATHGKANDREGDYSFLAFAERKDSVENEILYVRDLYNLNLNADLVTLSACETSLGKLQKGEGIISLARAFTFAGAKAIVTSLWGVGDESTKDLMLLFYRNLQKDQSKDAALRQAKRSLAKRPGSHPFQWAGFIAIGDMRPLKRR